MDSSNKDAVWRSFEQFMLTSTEGRDCHVGQGLLVVKGCCALGFGCARFARSHRICEPAKIPRLRSE